MIFGRPGSGKSTFSVELGEQLALPVYHVDKIFFESGWKERQREDFLQLKKNWTSQDNWIIDGNSMSSLELRFSRADIAIYFNLPWYKCLWRIFKRLWHPRDKRIDDRPPETPERVTWKLIRYMMQFRQRYNHKIYELARKYPNVHFIEIQQTQEIGSLLATIYSLSTGNSPNVQL
jgi:adenylate kinase family enzyme